MKTIAVMGHVDHGKTTLVSAISRIFGTERINCSGNELEILRTETKVVIGDEEYLFFDYPNDEDYEENLTGNENGAVLVVSAADGAMGGTEKAMDLCNDLGIERLVVFFNKCDIVEDEEFIDMMIMDIKFCFEERGMEGGFAIVCGSAKIAEEGSPEGIDEIKTLVRTVAETVQ